MIETVGEKTHAKRSPSGTKKRKLCPGSVVLEEGRENRASKYAAEGTVAHNVMELCLTEGKDAEAYVGRIFEADGFEFEVDMAMADAVNVFVADVYQRIDPLVDVLLVEQQVPIGAITGENGATGTADVVGIVAGTHLFVIDLKFGMGVRVNAVEADGTPNEQLCHYGLGALEEQELLHDIESVTLCIGQPRLQHFDEITMSVDDLRAQGKRLKAIEARCDSAEADANAPWFAERYLSPGEDQCRFCDAKAICPALRGEVVDLVSGGAATEDAFFDLDAGQFQPAVDELAARMAKVPLVEGWCKSIRAEVEAELFAGRAVTGFKLVQGKRGNRAWRDEADATAAMKAARLKADEMFDRKLISPSKAEKLLKDKPRVWTKLLALIGQSEGQPSVAPESDKRPALDLTAGADSFGDLTVNDGSDLV